MVKYGEHQLMKIIKHHQTIAGSFFQPCLIVGGYCSHVFDVFLGGG